MSIGIKSVSSENLYKHHGSSEDVLKSLSEENDSHLSSEKENSETVVDDIPKDLRATCESFSPSELFSYNPDYQMSPFEELENSFDHNSSDKLGRLPCDSCEWIEPLEDVYISYCWGCCKTSIPRNKISEYWLISVPKEEKLMENLNAATKSLSQNYKFHTPILKVGILNKLIGHLEHLKILDNFVKEVVQNLLKTLKNEHGNNPDLLEENLKIKDQNPATYLTRFQWDQSKYPTWHQISTIADQIHSYLDNINECLKVKLNLLEKLNEKIKPYEHRETEKLAVRYLGDIVKKEHFVQNSQYLTTLLVVVPNKKRKDWETTYINLCEMVVPDSSSRIIKIGDESLYNVTLSKKYIDEFKRNASAHNYIVRDFEYSEDNQASEKRYYENLCVAKSNLRAEILRWTKVMFGEAFEAWIHVKTLRVFVESVVRFGLPVNYQAMLLLPLKSRAKLKNVLRKLYKDIDPILAVGVLEDVPGGLDSYYDVDEYYPYVYFNIDLGFIYT